MIGRHIDGTRRSEPQRIGTADHRARTVRGRREPRDDHPVLETRCHIDSSGHASTDAPDAAQDRMPRLDRCRPSRVEATDRHAIGDLQLPFIGDEPGGQHVRRRQVRPLDPAHRRRRSNPERAASVRIEYAAEHRRRVEAGKAAPVDRAVDSDQRHRMTVADHPVVADAVHETPCRRDPTAGWSR